MAEQLQFDFRLQVLRGSQLLDEESSVSVLNTDERGPVGHRRGEGPGLRGAEAPVPSPGLGPPGLRLLPTLLCLIHVKCTQRIHHSNHFKVYHSEAFSTFTMS